MNKASRQEIEKRFTFLDFRDPLGHPLTNCVEFIELLDLLDIMRLDLASANRVEG